MLVWGRWKLPTKSQSKWQEKNPPQLSYGRWVTLRLCEKWTDGRKQLNWGARQMPPSYSHFPAPIKPPSQSDCTLLPLLPCAQSGGGRARAALCKSLAQWHNLPLANSEDVILLLQNSNAVDSKQLWSSYWRDCSLNWFMTQVKF